MRNLVYIVLMVVVAGCGFQGVHPQALDEAEWLMQSDPGAPLSALNGVDVSELNDSAVMARWA